MNTNETLTLGYSSLGKRTICLLIKRFTVFLFPCTYQPSKIAIHNSEKQPTDSKINSLHCWTVSVNFKLGSILAKKKTNLLHLRGLFFKVTFQSTTRKSLRVYKRHP